MSLIREAYGARYIDEKTLKGVASGGAASEISEKFLELGGVVFGVKYADDYRSTRFFVVKNVEELNRIKNTKYVKAEKIIVDEKGIVKNVYQVVADYLKTGKRVLFVGLGCEIAGLKSYLIKEKVSEEHLYVCDILCHGPLQTKIYIGYVDYLEKKYNAKISMLSMRVKNEGWAKPDLLIEFENGKKICKKFSKSLLYYGFANFPNKSCATCKFKGETHPGDITLGDYWGCKGDERIYSKWGVSLIIPHTTKGKDILKLIQGEKFIIDPVDYDYAINCNPMYSECRVYNDNSELFVKNMSDKGFLFAVLVDAGLKGILKKSVIEMRCFMNKMKKKLLL